MLFFLLLWRLNSFTKKDRALFTWEISADVKITKGAGDKVLSLIDDCLFKILSKFVISSINLNEIRYDNFCDQNDMARVDSTNPFIKLILIENFNEN